MKEEKEEEEKEEKPRIFFCPFLSASGRSSQCLQRLCMLWNGKDGCCFFESIFWALDAIADNLESVANRLRQIRESV